MNLIELARKYPDDEAARRWFVEQRWPDGVRCIDCGSGERVVESKHQSMDWWCGSCRSYFSWRKGSVMESSKLGAQTWLLAVYLLSQSPKGVSSVSLGRHLGITQKSAWHLGHRIRQAWADGDDPLMVGPVEIDETYVGGKNKNRHRGKKGSGRGPSGKAPVMGAADRHTGSVSLEAVGSVDGATAAGFVSSRVRRGADVFTDEAPVYGPLGRLGFRHGRVAHGRGEYRRGLASTNRIEGVWALLKRSYIGTYHWMSDKHLHRYCSEVEARVNEATSLRWVACGMVGKRLRYTDLTAP